MQRILAVPRPDWTPLIKALLSYGKILTVRMALEAHLVAEALAAPATRLQKANRAARLAVCSLLATTL